MKKIALVLVAVFLLTGCTAALVSSPSYAQGYGGYAPPPAHRYARPWVGPATPWVYYHGDWFLNGILYYYFGPTYGWAPYYAYPSIYIVRPGEWYGHRWWFWYSGHPHYWHSFEHHYPYWRGHHEGRRYSRGFYNRYNWGQGRGWHGGYHGYHGSWGHNRHHHGWYHPGPHYEMGWGHQYRPQHLHMRWGHHYRPQHHHKRNFQHSRAQRRPQARHGGHGHHQGQQHHNGHR